MRKIVAWIILSAMVLTAATAVAQVITRSRWGVQDHRYGGPFVRTFASGNTIGLDGMTPLNALAFGVDNTGATDCADSLNAMIALVEGYGGGAIYLPAGEYLLESEILTAAEFDSGWGVTIIGDGPRATMIQAGADSITLVHWASNFGGMSGIGLYGNSYAGVSGLRITPEGEAQTDSLVHQDYNTFKDMMIEDCDEGIVMQCGPYVAPSVSGCYYNTFSSIFVNRCLRGLWMKDGPNALSSGVNRNQFFGVRFGLQMNTGIQIDSGGTNSFFGCSVENVTTGTSPNTTPVGVKILYIAPVGTRGNSNNLFYGLISENCTLDLDCRNSTTEFYGHSMVGSKISTDGAALVPNVFLNSDYSLAPISLKRQQYNKAMNDSLGGGAPEMFVKGGAVPYSSGFYAPKGSLLMHTGGPPYYKAGTDSTDWRILSSNSYASVTADDTTPTVAGMRFLAIPANTVPTEITQLDGSYPYQEVTLVCTDGTNASVIRDGGNFILSENKDWVPLSGDTITLMTTGSTTWIEICRTSASRSVASTDSSVVLLPSVETMMVYGISGNIIIDLPQIAGVRPGHTVTVIKNDPDVGDTVRVRGYNNTASIDSVSATAKYLTTQFDRITVRYTSANAWSIIGGRFAGTAY